MEWYLSLIIYENISTSIMPALGGVLPLLPADRNQRYGLAIKLRRHNSRPATQMEHEHHPPQGLLLEGSRGDEILLPDSQR